MAAASATLRGREFFSLSARPWMTGRANEKFRTTRNSSQALGTAPGNAAHTSGVTLRTRATARMSAVPEA